MAAMSMRIPQATATGNGNRRRVTGNGQLVLGKSEYLNQLDCSESESADCRVSAAKRSAADLMPPRNYSDHVSAVKRDDQLTGATTITQLEMLYAQGLDPRSIG